MVDALVLGTSRAICGGSSPLPRTQINESDAKAFGDFILQREGLEWSFFRKLVKFSLILSHFLLDKIDIYDIIHNKR